MSVVKFCTGVYVRNWAAPHAANHRPRPYVIHSESEHATVVTVYVVFVCHCGELSWYHESESVALSTIIAVQLTREPTWCTRKWHLHARIRNVCAFAIPRETHASMSFWKDFDRTQIVLSHATVIYTSKLRRCRHVSVVWRQTNSNANVLRTFCMA